VDGEVHGAAAELEVAETGLKGGRSALSMWRHLVANGNWWWKQGPVVEAAGSGWWERGWSKLSTVAQR
jgi:hypothetical protein